MSLQVPQKLGPYELLSLIGAGGMGEVYRARDPRLERDVAIKVLPEKFASDAELRFRFEREAKAAAALSHPHICQVFDVGHDAGLAFIVMEYLEGESLARRLSRGQLPLQTAVEFAADIAEALAAAHLKGIVHRDLKPSNVMVVPFGVKLVDFGVAKYRSPSVARGSADSTVPMDTARGVLLGTLQYMSPEQLDGLDVDVRSDVFGLGGLLYETVTGVVPFAADSQAAIIAAILTREPAPARSLNPSVSAELEQVIAECLAKNPALRPTADAVARRLRALTGLSQARPPGRAPRRRPTTVRALAVVPFVATLRTEDQDAFADGMAEELIRSLGALHWLRVISRESSRRYCGSDQRVSQIAVQLKVDAVLRGQVTEQSPGLLIVSAELIGADEASLWSARYECERSDVLNVQEQIAQSVAASIQSSSAAPKPAPKKRRLNPRSHELYLKARFQFDNRLGNWLEASFDGLTQAIELDPTFAPPHAALSRWYLVAGLRPASPETAGPRQVTWPEACRQAEAEARLALKLEATLPDAHVALARVCFLRWQLPQAEAAFTRSLAQGASVQFHLSFSEFLSITNRPDEAVRHAGIARDLDPLTTNAYERLAGAYYCARRFEACLDACTHGIELTPTAGLLYYYLGQAQAYLGDVDASLKSLTIACARMSNNPSARAALAAALARSGNAEFATKILDELIRHEADPVDLAEIHVAAGRPGDALDYLERAFEAGSPYLLSIGVDPNYDPLRSHPRFKRLLNGTGLASYLDVASAR